MSFISRRENVVEQSTLSRRWRPIAVAVDDTYVLALYCSAKNEYSFAFWESHSHCFASQELDSHTAKTIQGVCFEKLSHIKLRVLKLETEVNYVVVGAGRDFLVKWMFDGNFEQLCVEKFKVRDVVIDFLLLDKYGRSIVTFENRHILVRDEEFNTIRKCQYDKEIPTDAVFVCSNEHPSQYLLCCFENGNIAAWDVCEKCEMIYDPLLTMKLSEASAAVHVCSIVQVQSPVLLSLRNGARTANSSRFCISSREGNIWIVECCFYHNVSCFEVQKTDLQKQLRFKNAFVPSAKSSNSLTTPDKEFKRGKGNATSIDCQSESSSMRVESSFNVLSICSSASNHVFIATNNGVLLSLDMESLKVTSQESLGDCDTTSKLNQKPFGTTAACAAIGAISVPFMKKRDRGMREKKSSNQRMRESGCAEVGFYAHSIAVFLTAFDRKLYLCTGYLQQSLPVEKAVQSRPVQEVRPYEEMETTKDPSNLPQWAKSNKSTRPKNKIDISPVTKRVNYDGDHGDAAEDSGGSETSAEALSFFVLSNAPLPPTSPLVACEVDATPPTTTGRYADSTSAASRALRGESLARGKGSWEKPAKKKNGALIDMPVTFHTRIKSSGYSAASNRPRQLGRSLSAPRGGKSLAKVTDRTQVKSRLRCYPQNCGPLTVYQPHNDYPPKKSNIPFSPIMNSCFSGDGGTLGLVMGGNAVCTLKTPLGRHKGEGNFYMGHDSQINSVEFSHDNRLIISSSEDCTARIWKQGKVDAAAVVFSHKYHNANIVGPSPLKKGDAACLSRQQNSKRNKPFSSAVCRASFYYLDKFVLVTQKSGVLMYTYDLHDFEVRNDLKRLNATGKYKMVHEWSLDRNESSSQFTTSASLNSVQCPVVIAATNSRRLLVLDSMTGQVSRDMSSGHERGIHCIALPQPSVHTQLPQSAYNLFATAATDNAVLLWDIRTPRSVNRFTSHVNRREKCQCSFSPCMQYLSVASEDRSARIYDTRKGSKEVAKLSGHHRDVVSSVSYHPIHPQLVTTSYDGSAKCYVSEI